MSKFINIVKKEIKDNKLLYIISLIIFIVLVYTHLNTFVSNDDLPYSFFYRGDERVKSLGQIFANQLADYKNLNGRFFVHFVLQFVLMFGKTLWSFINPLMIVTSLIMLVKIIKLKVKCSNNLGTILLVFMCFFLMFNYKAIIYWVAGSVNYVWVYTLLLIILYLYCMDFEEPLLLFGILVLFIVFFLLVCYRQSIYEKMPPTLQKFFDVLGRVFSIFALFSDLKNLGKLSGQSSKKYKGGQGKSGGGGSKRKF